MLAASWSSHSPRDGRDIGGEYTALLNWGRPVRVGELGIEVDASIPFTVVEQDINKRGERVSRSQRYKVKTRQYWYTLKHVDTGDEAVAFHWHPDAKGDVAYPHVHIGTVELSGEGMLSRKNHMPTGRMAFEQVLMLLRDSGAEPLRQDWENVLHQNLDAFIEWRTWH